MANEEARFNKLPKWVQREFVRLKKDVAFYKKQIAEMHGKEKTNTFMIMGIGIEKKPLVNEAAIEFTVDESRYINVCMINGELRIYGSDIINITPKAANSCSISLQKENTDA